MLPSLPTVFSILLIRHGQTDSNAGAILQGHLPVPLNDVGHRQARELAQRLINRQPPIRILISSDLRRAAQTAEPIAKALGITPIFDPAWRERGLGEYEGKAVTEKVMWDAASGQQTPPGAEPVETFQSRIAAALTDLPHRYAGQYPVAVITHGGPIRSIMRMLTDGRLPLIGSMPAPTLCTIENCSVWQMRWDGLAWEMNCDDNAAKQLLRAKTDAFNEA